MWRGSCSQADESRERERDQAGGERHQERATRDAVVLDRAGEQQPADRLAQPGCEHQRGGRRHRREDRAFEKNTGEEAPCRRAQCRPDGRLAPAPSAADEEQRRRVRQPDNEDEDRHAREGVGDAPFRGRDVAAVEADERHAAFERRARLRSRSHVLARLDARDDAHEVAERFEVPPRRVAHRGRKRHPDIHTRRRMAAEARRHDAGHDVLDPVDGHTASKNVRIAAERRAPEARG